MIDATTQSINNISDFDLYCNKVVSFISERTWKDPTEVFCSLVLSDVKLAMLDGVLPEDYKQMEW